MSLYEDNILSDERALERFWNKVEIIHPDDPDACYDWLAKKDKNGCGIFAMHCPQLGDKGYHTWKSFRAPRLMWILDNDMPVPDGLLVIHSCDNESCCNPKHIRLGTHQDNTDDRKLRGRWDTNVRGEAHPHSKLTVAKVRKICHLYFVKGLQPKAISDKMKVSRCSVHNVIEGKTWKHVTKTHIPKGFLHHFDKCKHRNELMYKAFKGGATYQEISRQFNVAPVYTRQILRKKRKEHGDKPTPIGFRSSERKRGR